MKQITLYRINELSESAKAKALDEFRYKFEFFSDSELEYFKESCEAFGLYVDKVYFSGFCNQGDGASFTGTYRYKKDWKTSFLKEYSVKNPYYKYGLMLQKQQSKAFYQDIVTIYKSGRYCHEYTMSIDNYSHEDYLEIIRDIARELYKQLESDYDEQNSDDYLIEFLDDNDYYFTETGGYYG